MDRKVLEDFLMKNDVRPNLKGFNYLIKATVIYESGQPAMRLYEDVADAYNTTVTRAERAIRHAIQTSNLPELSGFKKNSEVIAWLNLKYRRVNGGIAR